jgi:hypothetical protein
MSTTPNPPAPPARNNTLWWILGIAIAGCAVLVLAGFILTAFVARQVHIREAGKKVEIETPVGSVRVSTGEGRETGLPVYPGSIVAEGRGANVEFSDPEQHPNQYDAQRLGVAAEHYRSTDPLEKVEGWYRERLGSEFRLEQSEDGKRFPHEDAILPGHHDVAFVNDRGDSGVRVVALKRAGDGTEIDLVRVGKQEVQ